MSTRQRIATFIKTAFYVPDGLDVADDASLLDAGIIDSTGTLELIAFLEAEFAIQVEDHEITADNFDSLASITAFVAKKTAARTAVSASS